MESNEKKRLINSSDILSEAEKLLNVNMSDNLRTVLETQKQIRSVKENEIKFQEPVLWQNGNAIIFPHTINVIQGQAGVHKSRLAEMICSAFLKKENCKNELLGFNRNRFTSTHTVIYVDTERNLTEQLPYALQSIQLKAGFVIEEHPINFEFISLLQINRKDRFSTLNEYLIYIKQKTNTPLFIVLDVSTDCIEDFNRTDKSMELIDLMNKAINEHNLIFLCLIHENPKSDKARGHFGTELMNKSSTVMQVSFEKDAAQKDTELIRVKYLKCRSTARHTPFFIKYSAEAKGLILADSDDVSTFTNNRKCKALIEEVVKFLKIYLGDNLVLSRNDLLNKLSKDFNSGHRTIESRLKEIISSTYEIFDCAGNLCRLSKETINKEIFYKLVPFQN